MNRTVNNRREFLKKATLATAAMGVGVNLPAQMLSITEERLPDLGLIIGNTVKPLLEADHVRTMKLIAEIGYKNLEFSDYYGKSREDFKALLDDLGLKAVAGGGSLSKFSTSLSQIIDDSLFFGKEYLVCYWPWMDGGANKTLGDYKIAAAKLNVLGEISKENGLKFAFHAHDKEFIPIKRKLPYEILLDETDPDLVAMDLDLYWITKGKDDPIRLFKRNPGRFHLCHIKDMAPGPRQEMACPGQGIIDFQEIFAARKQAGLKYYMVEHDRPANPLACIREGYDYLSRLRF